tara:strand:- start:191 stop:1285 length:1095 start_codon:yes stop_codon:yes gene_type:complete
VNDIAPRSLRLEPFSKFSSNLRPARSISPRLFLKQFAGPAIIGTDAAIATAMGGDPLRETLRAGASYGTGVLGAAIGAPIPVPGTRLGGFFGGSYLGGQAFDKLWPDSRVNPRGMSNIPVGTKDFELQERLRQGAYIPPGMTTSAGVPVKGQPGDSFKDTRPVVGGGTVHSRTGGLGKYTGRSIGIPGTKFQVPLGDISPTIDIPKHQIGLPRSHGLDNIRTLGELNQLQGSSPFYRKGRGQRAVALRRLELGQQLENEANLEAQMLQEAMSPAEIQARDQWLDATVNSPAAQSGAFSGPQRWQTHLGDQQWQRDHGRPFTHGEFIPAAAPVVPVAAPVGGSWTPNLGGIGQGSSWTPPPGMFG